MEHVEDIQRRLNHKVLKDTMGTVKYTCIIYQKWIFNKHFIRLNKNVLKNNFS